MNDVLEQLLKVINNTFDFHKKISVNMALLQSNDARMATYSITIGVPQLVLMMLANIKSGTKSEYGHKFCSAMHAIHNKYLYNHIHNVASLQPSFNGACRCRQGEGSKRCSCPRHGNNAFRGQLGVIPSRDDGRRGHQLGVHQICVLCILHQ